MPRLEQRPWCVHAPWLLDVAGPAVVRRGAGPEETCAGRPAHAVADVVYQHSSTQSGPLKPSPRIRRILCKVCYLQISLSYLDAFECVHLSLLHRRLRTKPWGWGGGEQGGGGRSCGLEHPPPLQQHCRHSPVLAARSWCRRSLSGEGGVPQREPGGAPRVGGSLAPQGPRSRGMRYG